MTILKSHSSTTASEIAAAHQVEFVAFFHDSRSRLMHSDLGIFWISGGL
jgi:hypothetical protein